MRRNKLRPIPGVTHAARIRHGINARPPIRLRCAAASCDVLVLPCRQGRGLFNPNHVVLQPQVGINVLFVLEMPGNESRPVLESKNTPKRGELVTEIWEQLPPEILEVFKVRFTNFS